MVRLALNASGVPHITAEEEQRAYEVFLMDEAGRTDSYLTKRLKFAA
jgi:hypothetical protein